MDSNALENFNQLKFKLTSTKITLVKVNLVS